MTLTNLIDLIAEVAAKRAAEEVAKKEETPDAGFGIINLILARLWRWFPYLEQVRFTSTQDVPQL